MVDQLVKARKAKARAEAAEKIAAEYLLSLKLDIYRSNKNTVIPSNEKQMRPTKEGIVAEFGEAGYKKCLREVKFTKLIIQKK